MDLFRVLTFCALFAFSTEDGRSLILGGESPVIKSPFRVSSHNTGVILFSTTKENDTGLLFRHIIDKDSPITMAKHPSRAPKIGFMQVLIIESFDYYSMVGVKCAGETRIIYHDPFLTTRTLRQPSTATGRVNSGHQKPK